MALEFPDLGKHCSFKGCALLDFLPFTCSMCNKIYCLDHHKLKDHGCTRKDRIVPECPLCGQAITMYPDDDPNIKVDAHIRAGCPKEEVRKLAHDCTYRGCKAKELIEIRCKFCRKNFCVRHRMPPQHECTSEPKEFSSIKSTKKVEEKINRKDRIKERIRELNNSLGNKKGKKKATASRIQLMKMKKGAKGPKSVPQERRYYLQVVFPSDVKSTPQVLFFDSKWTIGRVLDEAAKAGRVPNYNNKRTAPYKLHVFSLQTGEPLLNMLLLEELPSEVLYSGDCILLEKVDVVPI